MASWSNCPEHVAFPGHLLQLGFHFIHFRLEDLGSPSSCAARRPCDLAAGWSSYKRIGPVFLPNDASATSKSLLRGPQEYNDLVFHVFSYCNDSHMLWSYPGGRCSANASSCRLFGLHADPFSLRFSAGSWFKGPAQATWMVTCETQVCLISWVFPHWECVNGIKWYQHVSTLYNIYNPLRNPFEMFFFDKFFLSWPEAFCVSSWMHLGGGLTQVPAAIGCRIDRNPMRHILGTPR